MVGARYQWNRFIPLPTVYNVDDGDSRMTGIRELSKFAGRIESTRTEIS